MCFLLDYISLFEEVNTMQKSILKLETIAGSPITFRTTIKTRHGRTLFLSLEINESVCSIIDCFYYDRNQGREGEARYKAKPKKLRTLQFPMEDLLAVIEAELWTSSFTV